MKKVFLICFFIVQILFVNCSNSNSQNIKTNLSATEFSDKIKTTSSALIIDVRTPDEYNKGHITNSKNIDWNGDDFDKGISGLDKLKPVFVYCLVGGRSSTAAKKMRAIGFKEVYELEGGIMKWKAENLPLELNSTYLNVGLTMVQYNHLIDKEKIVLIDFYAEWCRPCKKMKPYLDEIAKDYFNSVEIVRIDADDNDELCKELKVDGLPFLKLYNNKKLIWENKGYIEKNVVLNQINKGLLK